MRGFSFKLDKVLNYKENIENIKKAEYGDINQKLIREEEKLLSYHTYKKDLLEKRNEHSKGTTINNLKLYNRVLEDISQAIKNQEKLILDIKKELEKSKEELLVAMQEKKSFEKLKENDYEEYIVEAKKSEEKIIDEIVSFKNSSR